MLEKPKIRTQRIPPPRHIEFGGVSEFAAKRVT